MIDAERERGLALLPAAAWKAVDNSRLRGRVVFLTGATGFVGRWLLAALARINASGEAPIRVRALTRDARPVAAPWLEWIAGDVRDFVDRQRADLIVHAALPSTATPPGGDSALLDTALRGAEAVARHAKRSGECRTVVLSSGSVYGTASAPLTESTAPAEPDAGDAYARAKREVEAISRSAIAPGREVSVARLFTCIGTGYRAHDHLAHVSMIESARKGSPIVLRSDGSAIRSYLFGADLSIWLLTLLGAKGSDVVNVGSDEAMSLLDFARLVARVAGRGDDAVVVRGTDPVVRPHFVPDITRARHTYSLAPWTTAESAVTHMLAGS